MTAVGLFVPRDEALSCGASDNNVVVKVVELTIPRILTCRNHKIFLRFHKTFGRTSESGGIVGIFL